MSEGAPPEIRARFADCVRLLNSGAVEDAERGLRRLVALAPEFAPAHCNLGLALDRLGRTADAEACFRRSIEIDGTWYEAHLNLAALLIRSKRLTEAETASRRAVELAPGVPAAWSNLGVALACLGREIEAEHAWRSALAIDPEHASANVNYAWWLLKRGKFVEGWARLEARNWTAALERRLPVARWRGELLAGRSILLVHEGGLGDAIQFCRYVELVKRSGARAVGIWCPAPLERLMRSLDGVDAVVPLDVTPNPAQWDHWVPLMSLPLRFDTRLDSIPADLPYLRADPELAGRWRAALTGDGLRVGLVWKGSPDFENDADRSLPSLDTLAPLRRVAGVTWFSLQKGAGEDEALHAEASWPLRHLGGQFSDLADTAAALESLDLVVSVDTSTAHLAGALEKACWVLIPAYGTDWRWLSGRADSPWYPGCVRLFRQRSTGSWSEVVSEIAEALERRVAGKSAANS